MSDSDEDAGGAGGSAGSPAVAGPAAGAAGASQLVSMMPVSYPMCRLNDHNYGSWALKLEMTLRREHLWRFVTDPPAAPTAEEKLLDERAQSVLILSLEDQLLVYVKGLKTVKSQWDALKQIYVRESVASDIALTRSLYRTKLEPGGDLRAHLRKMQGYFRSLDDRKLGLSEYHKSLTLLSSLDHSWDTFALTLEAIDPATLTLPYLTGRLLQEAEKRSEAASHRGGNHKSSAQKEVTADSEDTAQICSVKKKSRFCWVCGDDKHFAKSCPKKKGKGQKQEASTEGKYQVSMVNTDPRDAAVWLLDSGTNKSIACDKGVFLELDDTHNKTVSLANGNEERVMGKGTVYLPSLSLSLHDVLYVPALQQNLLSVDCLVKGGFSVTFKGTVCEIAGNNTCVQIKQENGIYRFQSEQVQACFADTAEHQNCLHCWHKKLGHLSYKYIKETLKRARNVKLKKCGQFVKCEECAIAKSKVASFPAQSDRTAHAPFEIVHCDLSGPFFKRTLGGARYLFIVVDDYSRFTFSFLLKQKNEAFEQFKRFCAYVERRFKTPVIALQSDRGGEFLNTAFSDWLKRKGIVHRLTSPHSPSQNGVAERKLGTLRAMKDALLLDSGLNHGYAGEAYLTATHLLNRCYTRAIQDIPYALLFGKKPDLSYLHPFGCIGYVHIPQATRRKHQFKAQKLVFLGYEANSKCFRFLGQDGRSIVLARSATFDESAKGNRKPHAALLVPASPFVPDTADERQEEGVIHDDTSPRRLTPEVPGSAVKQEKQETPSPTLEDVQSELQEATPQVSPRKFLRSTRGIPPKRLIMENACLYSVDCMPEAPQDYKYLAKVPLCGEKKWQQATDNELADMEGLPYTGPDDQKAIDCRWNARIKDQGTRKPPICKPRLDARGFEQSELAQLDEIFSPTIAGGVFLI